ncbi:MAG: Large ribosomal subunit accumulation protein YceD [Betaproteobacteria bacterium]|nr:Large ribosomal subunit accumulation protein YceD [Betaproteobacteria bacterium]
MSARALIDSVEFARAGEQLTGNAPVSELTRLADSLFDTEGALYFELKGGQDARQRLRLHLMVDGGINLQCQRCLGKLVYPVSVQANLLVLTADAGGETGEIEDLDGVPASAAVDVWSLVEDEVLLAIPLSPRHAENECSPAVKEAGDPAASPFAALAKLAQERNKNRT